MSPLATLQIPAETLLRARRRDGAALESIYRSCFHGVRALVRRLVTRSDVVDEITQDVFVQVLRHLDGYTGKGPFGAWVRSIAVSRCLMYLRSPWNRAALWLDVEEGDGPVAGLQSPPVESPDETFMRTHAEVAALEAALGKLSPLNRTVVWLHDVEGYTHVEIARELGRSVSFSKSALARAHERLRQLLSVPEGRVVCTPASSSC